WATPPVGTSGFRFCRTGCPDEIGGLCVRHKLCSFISPPRGRRSRRLRRLVFFRRRLSMNVRWIAIILVALGLAVGLPWSGTARDDRDAGPEQGVEVLARGPVHEAYAEPVESRPQQSLVVNKQPPEAIDEVPPDQKPEGEDVVWIPGYWGWDEGQQD